VRLIYRRAAQCRPSAKTRRQSLHVTTLLPNGLNPSIQPQIQLNGSNTMAKKIVSKKAAVKVVNKAVKSVKADSNIAAQKSHELIQAGVGAVAMIRKKSEKLINQFTKQSKGLQNKAKSLVNNIGGDVLEQANGVLAQVKSAVAANANWAGEKAEDAMGKVLSRLGVPSKSDVKELSRRVAELHKQVKAMQKAA
jgi:poly(hydroxyalkanoate) granule-associated protein